MRQIWAVELGKSSLGDGKMQTELHGHKGVEVTKVLILNPL